MPARRINRLPSLPTIAVEILRIFSEPDVPIQAVADLVQADPAMTSKILKAANSSRFGLGREVADLRQAITLLGKARVTPIVLSFSLTSESMDSPEHVAQFKRVWLRSFVQATAGEVLGSTHGPGFAAECFTTNLLAGIGQLGLLRQDTNKYLECLERVKNGETLESVELEVFGATHSQLTREMMQNAGLPSRCLVAVSAIEASDAWDAPDDEIRMLGQVSIVASACTRYLCDDNPGVALVLLKECLASLNVESMNVDRLSEAVRNRIDQYACLFDIDPDQLPDPEDLLADAIEQLAEFTTRMDEDRTVPDELVAENGRLKLQVADLVKQTSTDALTGVANRSFFDRRLYEMTQQCLRNRQSMGVAVIDIDHFKVVNDNFGHQAGDYVLSQVAEHLEAATRTNETLARYGGEEFAVLMDDVTDEGMRIMGERLRARIDNLRLVFAGVPIAVTISIGIAGGIPTSDKSGLQLFAQADSALYRSKQAGRNRVTIDCSNSTNAPCIPVDHEFSSTS